MARQTFFDSILVSDDEFDLARIEDVYAYLKTQKKKDGIIRGLTDDTETKFTAYTPEGLKNFSDIPEDGTDIAGLLLKEILSGDIVPILPDHDITYAMNAHEMTEGGGMAFHQDAIYSVAVSIYLNSVEGGEFEAQIPHSDGVNFHLHISPKAARAVVVKANTMHRVRKVTSGIRRNIQIFIKYTKRQG
jgi:hypothetical protein